MESHRYPRQPILLELAIETNVIAFVLFDLSWVLHSFRFHAVMLAVAAIVRLLC